MKRPCKTCQYRENKPLTYEVYQKHLEGQIIGIYPLLDDETCYFLAFDFDDILICLEKIINVIVLEKV